MPISTPILSNAVATQNGINTQILVLWKNTGDIGYSDISVFDDIGTLRGSGVLCSSQITEGQNISRITIPAILNTVEIRSFKCSSDVNQNCTTIPPTCTTPVLVDSIPNIIVNTFNTTLPDAPSNLTIIPGDSILTVSWNPVINTEIFTYFISTRDIQTDQIVFSTYLTNNQNSFTIRKLTNGKIYQVSIMAGNNSFIFGPPATTNRVPTTGILGNVGISGTTLLIGSILALGSIFLYNILRKPETVL